MIYETDFLFVIIHTKLGKYFNIQNLSERKYADINQAADGFFIPYGIQA